MSPFPSPIPYSDPEFLELARQGVAAPAEQLRRLLATALRGLQRLADQRALELRHRVLEQRRAAGSEARLRPARERLRPVQPARRGGGDPPPRSAGRSASAISRPAASTVRRRQAFTSWRTLPGQPNATSTAPRPRCQHLRCHAELDRGDVEVVAQQLGDVLAAVAQRRHLDADHVQAVEQVLAEQPFLDARLEVLVRGGDDAHVHLHRQLPAHAIELALRQHAQQPRLQRRATCRRSRRGTACRRRPARSGRGAARRRR